jgi:3-hydroxyacyl-CoA dehydrogenase / enoyl-CoA hydratase / 3-hydroxybutyryl-CoA epimerase
MSALSMTTDDGIALVTLDTPGQPVNVISRAVRDEFTTLIADVEKDTSIRGVVLVSGKADSFIAGADIEEFLQWTTAAHAETASLEGHVLLDRIEALRVPVVVAIHGACLGGGLETALACAYRIATDHPKTVLGLPEVQIGLFPGAGGTQRLPRTIGLQAALDMILTGRNVRARKALQTGLVHEIVHPAILVDVATRRAREIAQGTRRRNPNVRPRGARNVLLDDNPIGRAVVLRKARERTLATTHGNYPAPLAAIDVVAAGYDSRAKGYREEARRFGEMAMTPQCRELIFLFFATTALKKDSGVSVPAPDPQPVHKLGVVGAGFMGSGIAAIAAQSGTIVRLKDADLAHVGKGLAAARVVLEERLKKKQITPQVFQDQLSLLGGSVDFSGFRGADLVIEAVFEDLKVKHDVVHELEGVVSDQAVIASNTSTLPIAQIAEAAARPGRVLGMHFFSPVHKMPLLEVIEAPGTDPEAVATAVAYGKTLGKTVIVVNDAPGFYVNRILAPYLNEAGRLLDSGASVDAIDKALVDFGFPVGPLTLLDEVGLDIAGKSGTIFYETFGERMAPSQALTRVVASGRLGRKGKKGFYSYDEAGKKGGVDESVYPIIHGGAASRIEIAKEEIQNRCVLAMVSEAVRCLEEGIIRSSRDGDVGAVFGIGFPPFRGGPFRFIDAVGADKFLRQLEDLSARFPPRFAPCERLVQMARREERFYPAVGRPVT